MKRTYLCIYILLVFVLSSCGNKVYYSNKTTPAPVQTARNITKQSYSTERLDELKINLTNAQIEFSSWARKEVCIEIDKAVPNKTGNEKTISDYKPIIKFKNDKLFLEETSKQNEEKNLTSRYKIYAPCNVKNLSVYIESGSFVSYGDIITSAQISINKGNVNFTRFQGVIDAKVSQGNISISSGRLCAASKLIAEAGNVSVKSEILTKDNYIFEAGVGNVELILPARISADFLCQGNVVKNDFKSSSIGSNIIVTSKQGAISLIKY